MDHKRRRSSPSTSQFNLLQQKQDFRNSGRNSQWGRIRPTRLILLAGLVYVWYIIGNLEGRFWPDKVTRLTYGNADDFLDNFEDIFTQRGMSVQQAMYGCRWPQPELVNFQFGPDKEWVTNLTDYEKLREKRTAWHKFLKFDAIPYKKVAHRFEGRGIVICGGNDDTFVRLEVLLRILRFHGTPLPVEVHHHGDSELGPEKRAELTALFPNIYFNDLAGPDVLDKAPWNSLFPVNYNVKIASIINSRFAEIIMLDSDNFPVSDPSVLFESKRYQNFGTVFYPDIARTRPENPMWAITNTPCQMDEWEMESGQVVVDKRRFWYHLQLAAFFAREPEYPDFILGDKDCFRFAWHALDTPFGQPDRWITSVGFVGRPASQAAFPSGNERLPLGTDPEVILQGGENSVYCGHSFGQHHPDGHEAPILFLHGGLLKTLTPAMVQHARKHSFGAFSAYKRSTNIHYDRDVVDRVWIKFHDGSSYLPETTPNHIAYCTDFGTLPPGVAGDEVTKELQNVENMFEKAGGFWMTEQPVAQ